jgi:L-malate glycosyltransferase
MTKILHVTPHLGTGVGKAISSLAIGAKKYNPEFDHEIIVLEKPQKPFYHEICEQNGIKVHTEPNDKFIYNKIVESDIIQIEWWHHPLSFKFLNNLPKFPMRTLIWYHTNGCCHPYLKPEIVSIPQKFVVTSQYTIENPYWTESQRIMAKLNFEVVNSSGGFEGFNNDLESHHGFNVGYFGTLEYSKMYPGFVEYCESISDIPNIKFIMIGGGSDIEQIKEDALRYKLEDKFTFTGFIPNVSKELAKLDVVAYLLNPCNYGTTENALLEMMAMGIPVIVFNQCSEKYIVTSDKCGGYKITSKEEFKEIVNMLYNFPEKKKIVGDNAKQYVRSIFTQENMVRKMHLIYHETMKKPAREMNFRNIIGTTPKEWFESCLIPDKNIMNKQIMKNTNKQSIYQFIKYFPENKELLSIINEVG